MVKQKTIKALFGAGLMVFGLFMFGAVAKAETEGEIQLTDTGLDRLRDIIADGQGGAIIGWVNPDKEYTGYVQKVNKNGEIIWTQGGVGANKSWNWNFKMVSDGDGGAILVDEDTSNDYYYIQRVTKSGNLKWGQNGVKIGAKSVGLIKMVSDNAGGVFLFLSKPTKGYEDLHLFIQKIKANGDLEYDSTGKQISLNNDGNGVLVAWGGMQAVNVMSDGSFIVVGQDQDGNKFLQKFNSQFNSEWITDLPAIGDYFSLVTDEVGGALIVSNNKFVRIDKNGVITSGQEAKTLTTDQDTSFDFVSADENVIAVWSGKRNGNDLDVFAQNIDQNSNFVWGENGISVSTQNNINESIESGLGYKGRVSYSSIDDSVLVGWDETNSDNDTFLGSSIAKIDISSDLKWVTSPQNGGIPLPETGASAGDVQLVADGKGGLFAAWLKLIDPEKYQYSGNIYALRLDSEGKIIKKEEGAVNQIAYFSKKGKKGNFYDFKKKGMKFKMFKFPFKDRQYWAQVGKVKKNMPSFNAVKVIGYWKIKTNLNKLGNQSDKLKIQLTFRYNHKDLKKRGLKEKNLALYYYNGYNKKWTKLNAKQYKKKNEFSIVFKSFPSNDIRFAIGKR